MVNLNRQIGISRAQQGGFSAHVLPSPVSYAPVAADWGLGWLFWDIGPIVNGLYTTWTVTAVSADGSSSSSFTVDTGSISTNVHKIRIYPVNNDTMLVVFRWGIYKDTTNSNVGDPSAIHIESQSFQAFFGTGKQGFLVRQSSTSVVDIPSTLSGASIQITEWPVNDWDGAAAEEAIDLFTGTINGWGVVNSSPNVYPGPEFGTGAIYENEPTPAGNYRISLESDSGFAGAVDAAEAIRAADKGSCWYPNYNDWDGRLFKLEQNAGGAWNTLRKNYAIVDNNVSFGSPAWIGPFDQGGFIATDVYQMFNCLVSVPYSDRRAWFQTEHGLTIP
jgi:hypothetical protein